MVLIAPDFKKKFIVQTNASEIELGAVLCKVVKREGNPVPYLTRNLSYGEKNFFHYGERVASYKWALDAQVLNYLVRRLFRLV